MSWFRRGNRSADEDVDATGREELDDDAEEASEAAQAGLDVENGPEAQDSEAAENREAVEAERARLGPFDVSEVDDDVVRVDLGALQVPPRQGMEFRLELEEKTQRVIAVTITLGGSSVQMQPFAAPRSEGVWGEIRQEIAQQVNRQGGTADDLAGRLGRELLARIPARTPDGRTGHQVVRFTGIDGPRWFLRAVFNGKAAVDEEAAAELEQVVRGTVVVRGSEAMAPRDLLPMHVPSAPVQAEDSDAEPDAGSDGPNPPDPPDPFHRGPEITEIH